MKTMIDPETLKKNLSRNLEAAMAARGISQNQLAKELPLTQSKISRVLAQISIPDACELANIAEFFRLTVDDLISNQPLRAKKNLQRKLTHQS